MHELRGGLVQGITSKGSVPFLPPNRERSGRDHAKARMASPEGMRLGEPAVGDLDDAAFVRGPPVKT